MTTRSVNNPKISEACPRKEQESANAEIELSIMDWMDDEARQRWTIGTDGEKYLFISTENMCVYSLEKAETMAVANFDSLGDDEFEEFLAAWHTLKRTSLDPAAIAFMARELANGEPELVETWVKEATSRRPLGERMVNRPVGKTV